MVVVVVVGAGTGEEGYCVRMDTAIHTPVGEWGRAGELSARGTSTDGSRRAGGGERTAAFPSRHRSGRTRLQISQPISTKLS